MSACRGDHCVTCADEGIAMRVLALDTRRGLALCAAEDGARETVEIALVEPVAPGDRVLVHAGVALVKLDGGPPPPDREARPASRGHADAFGTRRPAAAPLEAHA